MIEVNINDIKNNPFRFLGEKYTILAIKNKEYSIVNPVKVCIDTTVFICYNGKVFVDDNTCMPPTAIYFCNGNLHRLAGPAIEETNGDTAWFYDGHLHRLDGPAIENANGDKFWYINDIEYSYLEYIVAVENYKLTSNNNHEKSNKTYI